MKKQTLISLAEKGSLKAFKASLQEHPRPIPQAVLFSALRNALAWNSPQKAELLLRAGADPLAVNEENDQLLTHAAISGAAEPVRLMLAHGCDENHRNIHGRTPLHSAAAVGNTEGVRLLIQAGADPDCRDRRGLTPLIEAIANNRLETAMELVRSGVDIHTCRSLQQETPLMLAASHVAVSLVQLLLDKGSDIESRDFIGCTPLMHAARHGTAETVQLLLDAGADRNARDNKGQSPLQWASSLRPEIAILLLGKGPQPPLVAREALLKAATDGNVPMIQTLLRQKAPIQPVKEGGESALLRAVFQKSMKAFQLLLNHPSADVNYREGRALRTPLLVAARLGDVHKARLLLESGALLSVMDADAMDAVHHAAMEAKKEILALFFRHGSSLSNSDVAGRSLIHLAIASTGSFASIGARMETVTWLLQQGLNPNASDHSGTTPLMLAAANAYREMAAAFIEAGAEIDAMDLNGRTALVHALFHGTEYGYNDRYARPTSEKGDGAAPVVRMLLRAGADPILGDARTIAAKWRWPGAASLLEGFSTRTPPSRGHSEPKAKGERG